MKKNILILVLVALFGISNVFAQDKKEAKSDSKISEVILTTEMHCQDCADKVKKQLAYTKGVIDVQTNYEKNAVYVKYRNDKTNNDALIKSLKEINYDAKVMNTQCSGKCPHAQGGCGQHQQQAQPAHNCGSSCPHSQQAQPSNAEHKCSGDHKDCNHGQNK
ncbi:MAG: cation transporter [Bacteroidales bacterium]|nr:cation transporter [Bacteroidales bacterium]